MKAAAATKPAEPRVRGARPQLPRLGAVLAEQIRTAGFAMRRPALIAAALMSLITVITVLQSIGRPVISGLYHWPTVLPGLLGTLLPIALWSRDERFGPGFLWTLPVDRGRHAFTKVLAGWVWLMGGVVVFAVWHLVITGISGGHLLPPETLQVLTSPVRPRGPIDPAMLRTVPWSPGPAIWAVPFTAATACYLLASALLLGSRHPLRWAIGAVLVYALAGAPSPAATAQPGLGWLGDLRHLVLLLRNGRYGLDALLTARNEALDLVVVLTTGERRIAWFAVPDMGDWLTATLLWTALGAVVLAAAAYRHRERRRD